MPETDAPSVLTVDPELLAIRSPRMSDADLRMPTRGLAGATGGGSAPTAAVDLSPGAPAVVIGAIGSAPSRRSAAINRMQIILLSVILAAFLLFSIAVQWSRGLEKKPWLSYTEDWVDGFFWRWDWKKSEVKNLRGFCPTCRSEVIFRPIAIGRNAPDGAPPGGTWAFCPKCKEATGLETNDVPQAVAATLTRRRQSGEYRETVAASKRKAGIASERTVRLKVVAGRIV
jgi:hypothetical protein